MNTENVIRILPLEKEIKFSTSFMRKIMKSCGLHIITRDVSTKGERENVMIGDGKEYCYLTDSQLLQLKRDLKLQVFHLGGCNGKGGYTYDWYELPRIQRMKDRKAPHRYASNETER